MDQTWTIIDSIEGNGLKNFHEFIMRGVELDGIRHPQERSSQVTLHSIAIQHKDYTVSSDCLHFSGRLDFPNGTNLAWYYIKPNWIFSRQIWVSIHCTRSSSMCALCGCSIGVRVSICDIAAFMRTWTWICLLWVVTCYHLRIQTNGNWIEWRAAAAAPGKGCPTRASNDENGWNAFAFYLLVYKPKAVQTHNTCY